MIIWIIYDHLLDFPDWFVARKEIVGKHWPEVPHSLLLDRRLESLRQTFYDRGLYRIPRDATDDRCIVESWL